VTRNESNRNPGHVPRTVAPHVIQETAVYSVEEAQAALRLRPSTIRRELREGRLRVAKRAGRYYLLGEWLMEWLRAGEVRRAPACKREDQAK
jgi:Helix-turn-helix domain